MEFCRSLRNVFFRAPSRVGPLAECLSLFGRGDTAGETLLYDRILELTSHSKLSDYDEAVLERLKDLSQLRRFAFGESLQGEGVLRQGFILSCESEKELGVRDAVSSGLPQAPSLDSIFNAAVHVAELYGKLHLTLKGEFPELSSVAHRLYKDLFGESFEPKKGDWQMDQLVDGILKERGVPFLILNFLKQGRVASAKRVSEFLLLGEIEVDEDLRSALYWVCELYWFSGSRPVTLSDYETSLRYLYHLCFTNPDRAGFLEIDSQFFSQFETVNELAREGFLYRENLMERVLEVWKQNEGFFDSVFQRVLESMSQRRSKIYQGFESWERFWKREKENFSKDYLYVVEGNLSFSMRHYEDAVVYYEKALEFNPALRAALLNLLFAYAKLDRSLEHEKQVARVVKEAALYPSCLHAIGNSFLLKGSFEKADHYYDQLRAFPGWENKVDYYKSTFCYEQGMFREALHYAQKAHERNPHDGVMSFHLSQCYSALGRKDLALEMLKRVGEKPELQWLNFYRFTLERDTGHNDEALKTLLGIPSEYFEDPEELNQALNFARQTQDLVLLRHLRNRT